jgi:PPM family protein phosphatase
VTPVATLPLAAACRSDAGRVRGNNEDLGVCEPERGIFAVIDGVGGQSAGEVAAAIARRVVLERLARPLGTPAERVREAIALANNEIYKAATEFPEYRGMTCVLTLALVIDRQLTIGHVGDSRMYELSPRGIRKLTHDHSPVGEREDAQEISEPDAMRHPRRNEVFRDVGSACRDKDEDGFVEIVEAALDDDSAILLCTDGLTDLVPSSAIASVVSEHAGGPQAVADALVAAANDAGGSDNVTVVYAEMPGFARGMRDRGRPDSGSASQRGRAPVSWVAARRATWLLLGMLLGVSSAFLLAWGFGAAGASAPRTLVVGPAAASPFARIADAVATARPGDVIQLEPGEYAEQVRLPGGVDLVARVPGTATLTRPDAAAGDWRAVDANGSGSIRGLRIVSTPDTPMSAAIHISGTDRRVEQVDIEGPMDAGIDIAAASGVTVSACVIHTMQGPGAVIDGSGDVTFANNTFVRTGGGVVPAVRLKNGAWLALNRNLFAGYRPEIIGGTSAETSALLLSGNFVVASEPSIAR